MQFSRCQMIFSAASLNMWGGGSRAGYNRSASMLHLYMERLLCGNFCFFVTAAL